MLDNYSMMEIHSLPLKYVTKYTLGNNDDKATFVLEEKVNS